MEYTSHQRRPSGQAVSEPYGVVHILGYMIVCSLSPGLIRSGEKHKKARDSEFRSSKLHRFGQTDIFQTQDADFSRLRLDSFLKGHNFSRDIISSAGTHMTQNRPIPSSTCIV